MLSLMKVPASTKCLEIGDILAVGAVICEPVSDAHSLFSGKIQGSLPILAQEVSPVVAFPHVDQWVGRYFPEHENREFFLRSRECFWADQGASRAGSVAAWCGAQKFLPFIVQRTISLPIRMKTLANP